MTREEALKELNELREYCEDTFLKRTRIPYLNALDMAIEALKVEPCEDSISRKKIEKLKRWRFSYDTNTTIPKSGLFVELADIRALPPIHPKPKTGHWIFDEILDKHYYCSECKSMGVDYWDFCPYCGAKMVEPQESEDQP